MRDRDNSGSKGRIKTWRYEVEKNGRTYVDFGDGNYGIICEPGSELDNTSGKVGLHVEYLQYAEDTEIVRELRAILPEFRGAMEAEREEQARATITADNAYDEHLRKLQSHGLCSKCGTFCDGDCTA